MAREVAEQLRDAGLTVETDFRNEKINYKVREHSVTKVPVIIVCGKREAEERTVNIRRLGCQEQTSMSLDEAIASLGARGHAAGCPSQGGSQEGERRPDFFAANQTSIQNPPGLWTGPGGFLRSQHVGAD